MRTEVLVALIATTGTVVSGLVTGVFTYLAKGATKTDGSPDGSTSGEVSQEKSRTQKAIPIVMVGFSFVALVALAWMARWGGGGSNPMQALVESGDRAGKKYVLPSVTMLVRLEKDATVSPMRLVADERIAYVVRGLKRVDSDSGAFEESFHTSTGDTLEYVPGADRETMLENAAGVKRFFVNFVLQPFEQRTVITGVRSLYPSTLAGNRSTEIFHGLQSNEDAFCYPNQDDYIGELVIRVESSTLAIRPSTDHQAAFLREGQLTSIDPSHYEAPGGNGGHWSVAVARFKNLQPKDIAGLVVLW